MPVRTIRARNPALVILHANTIRARYPGLDILLCASHSCQFAPFGQENAGLVNPKVQDTRVLGAQKKSTLICLHANVVLYYYSYKVLL